jgi:hypothetical protein
MPPGAGAVSRSVAPTARTLGLPSGSHQTTMDSDHEPTKITKPQVNSKVDLGFESAPSGTRTPNPLIKSQGCFVLLGMS